MNVQSINPKITTNKIMKNADNNQVHFSGLQAEIQKLTSKNARKLEKLPLGQRIDRWIKTFLELKNVEAGSYKVKPHFEPYNLFARGLVEIQRGAKVATDYFGESFKISGKVTKDGFIHAKKDVLVMPGAKVKGGIKAQRVDVIGVVDGDIHAKEVNIFPEIGGRATGKIFADIVNGQSGIANKEEIPVITTVKAGEIACGRLKGKILNIFGTISERAKLDFEIINNYDGSKNLGEINNDSLKQMNFHK